MIKLLRRIWGVIKRAKNVVGALAVMLAVALLICYWPAPALPDEPKNASEMLSILRAGFADIDQAQRESEGDDWLQGDSTYETLADDLRSYPCWLLRHLLGPGRPAQRGFSDRHMAMLIPYLKPSLACREQLLNEVVLPMLSSPPTGWRQRVMITLGQALGCDDPRFFRLVFDKLLAHHRDESDNAWKMELYERCLTYAYVVCYIIQWQPPHPKFIIEQDHLNQWYSETINHLPEHSVLLTASEFLALPDDPRVWPAIRARLLDKIRLNETENRAAIEAIMASANLPLGKSQPSMDSAIASELLAILLRHHPAPDVALATRIVASFPMEFDVPYFSLFGELARLAPGRVDLLVQAVQNGQCRSYDPNYRYGLFSNNLPDTWTMDDRLALLRQLLPMTVSEDPAWREKGWILGLCRSLRLPLPDEARRALVTQYPALVAP